MIVHRRSSQSAGAPVRQRLKQSGRRSVTHHMETEISQTQCSSLTSTRPITNSRSEFREARMNHHSLARRTHPRTFPYPHSSQHTRPSRASRSAQSRDTPHGTPSRLLPHRFLKLLKACRAKHFLDVLHGVGAKLPALQDHEAIREDELHALLELHRIHAAEETVSREVRRRARPDEAFERVAG